MCISVVIRRFKFRLGVPIDNGGKKVGKERRIKIQFLNTILIGWWECRGPSNPRRIVCQRDGGKRSKCDGGIGGKQSITTCNLCCNNVHIVASVWYHVDYFRPIKAMFGMQSTYREVK